MNPRKPLPPDFLEAVRRLRSDATDAEAVLWELLRNRRVGGFRVRRQHVIDRFVLGFYCHEAKLGIEIDGGVHDEQMQRRRDTERTEILNEFGIRMIRFTNAEVIERTESVLRETWQKLTEQG